MSAKWLLIKLADMDKQSEDARVRRSRQTRLENLRSKMASGEELNPVEEKTLKRLEKVFAAR